MKNNTSSLKCWIPIFFNLNSGKYKVISGGGMKVALMLIFLHLPNIVFGAVRTSSGSGNWNSTATWGGLSVPVAGDDVTIGAGHTVTITANAACTSILFSNQTTLTFSGAFTLNVSGTVTMPLPGTNNPITLAVGSGTVTVNGLFTMSGGSGNVARVNNLTISTGTVNLNGGITAAAARCNITFSNAGVLNISGTVSGGPAVLTASTGTVNYTGNTAQNIWVENNYYNLGISGSAVKTLTGTLTVSNLLSVGALSTLELPSTGTPLSYAGTISGTGKVLYSGIGAQTVTGLTYYDLQTSNSGLKTLGANATVANILTIDASTTLDLSTFTLTLSGGGTPLVNNGTFTPSTSTVLYTNASSTVIAAVNYNNLNGTGGPRTLAGSGTIGIAGVFTKGAGAYTVTGSTVNFNGSGAQTIPAFTFNDVILSGLGSKTILTATAVNVNTIQIQDGPTLDLPGTAQLNITQP